MRRTVIILGGGKGQRMGGDLPKQFIPLQGKPVLMHTIDVFYRWDQTIDLVLVIPEEHATYWSMLCRELNFTIPHKIVLGGETRFHSVRNGLLSLPAPPAGYTNVPPDLISLNSPISILHSVFSPDSPSASLIAVHDGVRPFVSPDVISACFEKAEAYGAAIPVIPMIDTVRVINGDANCAFDRTRLRVVQTPQVFHADILRKAYEQPYDKCFTDDASLVEASGHPIYLVEGNHENIKITTPVDIQYAKILMENKKNF